MDALEVKELSSRVYYGARIMNTNVSLQFLL